MILKFCFLDYDRLQKNQEDQIDANQNGGEFQPQPPAQTMTNQLPPQYQA